MADRNELDELCAAFGIAREYHQIGGMHRVVPERSLRALLAAIHVPAGDGAGLRQALHEREARTWRRMLPPVRVVRHGSPEARSIELTMPAEVAQRAFEWRLTEEDGTPRSGRFVPEALAPIGERTVDSVVFRRYALPLPELEHTGYHRLEIVRPDAGTKSAARMALIVVPDRCYQPPALAGGGRTWGPALQLYAVRSMRNWGMGDFTDLLRLVEFCAQAGAGILGVNPLHALFPHDPAHAGPYSPSSRLFLNVLYIDVEAVADYQESSKIRRSVARRAFQARLKSLRATELVDYPGVAAAKMPVLRACYEHFQSRHLTASSQRAAEFRSFRDRHGEALRAHVLFEALQAHFHAADPGIWGWPAWSKSFRLPSSPDVVEFERSHEAEVGLYAYLQWQAEIQLAAVAHRSAELGLAVGIYRDLAVGVNPGGAEAWSQQDLYARGVHVGAPPDDFNANGQEWGLPPFVPHLLEASGYEQFIATLRAGMRGGGALRIDHVMGLMRLFWVPAGSSAAEGTYVGYPFSDLLGILALESQRNRCLVIGEDLGTVPEGLRPALAQAGVLSYRVLIFERGWDGSFKPPAEYPEQALVCVSTHDLPTLGGFWLGRDIEARTVLGLYPSEEMGAAQAAGRAEDRKRLLAALRREGLWPEEPNSDEVVEMRPDLALSVHRYLARSPSKVLMVQAEDALGSTDQANLPGADQRHPNWRRKLPLDLEHWGESPAVRDLFAALREERGC
jgi:(1->4)-alpha-D-glucan 1-alpha-D-glucosylmutase